MNRFLPLLAAVAALALFALSGPVRTEAANWDACNGSNGETSGIKARFADAGLTDAPRGVNTATDVPQDPKAAFKTSFPADVDEVFANLTVTTDSEPAWVTVCWRYNGLPINAYYDDIVPGEVLSGMSVFHTPHHHIPAGAYEGVFHLIGTTETRSLKFTVGDASNVSTPTFAEAGVVPSWSQKEYDDPTPLFATSFTLAHEGSDDRRGPFAVVKLTGGDSWVTQRMLYNGLELRHESYEASAGEWRGIDTTLIDDADAGDYELQLSIAGSTDTRTLKFTIVSPSTGSSPRFSQIGTYAGDVAGYPWCGPAGTIFGVHTNPVVEYSFPQGSANAGAVLASLRYRGVELQPNLLWFNVNRYLGAGDRSGQELVNENSPWKGEFIINDASAMKGIPRGDYQATVRMAGPGISDTRTLSFSISPDASSDAVKGFEKFDEAGALASWDGCTPPASLRANGASFSVAGLKGAMPRVVFKLSEGRQSDITYTVRKDGRNLEASGGGATFTLPAEAVRGGGWGALDVALDPSSPSGAYEVSMTLSATGETTRVSFNVTQ